MKKLLLTLALAPTLVATGAFAQSVSDDVNKQLWCGEAFTIVFSTGVPSDATSEQLAQAQVYVDGGNKLIDEATQAHLDAGFTEEQVTKIKSDLVAEITPVVTGDGSNAKYTFEDCAALLQPADASAPADATSSSSAM
jgi:hypothetical protein